MRNGLFLFGIIAALQSQAVAQESPQPGSGHLLPQAAKQLKEAHQIKLFRTGTSCVCSVFPIYQDGNDYLYYAELCDASAGCPVSDIVYYWQVLVNWPLTCAGENGCGDCDVFGAGVVKVAGPFPGMKKGIGETDSAHAPWPTDIPWGSGPNKAHPKKGHKGELSDLVHFKTTVGGTSREVYAKLFIVKVLADGGANVNAPKPQTAPRYLHLGYELDKKPSGTINEVPATDVLPAIQKKPMDGTVTSDYAKEVVFAKEHYIVLLKQ